MIKKKIIVIIEKTDTGFSAYSNDYPVFTTGSSMNDLIGNCIEAEKIGMNPTLLSQYVRGHKRPSSRQSRRILYGINKIGQELADINVVYERKKTRD